MSFIFTDQFQYKNNATVDAYAKLRVSNPFGLFNSSLQNDINPAEWESVTSGGGGVTYLPEQSSASLTVGTASGARVLRQTLETFQYQAGTGTDVLMTGVLGTGSAGAASRIGIFDDFNGLFWEVQNGQLNVVLRNTLAPGDTQEIRVASQNFTHDKLDGTGPSGMTIDLTKSQIYRIDYAWLGVGRARFSLWTGNCFCIIHELQMHNVLDTPYMGKGDLPLRYELINLEASSGASMKQICSAVFVEGGVNKSGFTRAAFTAPNEITRYPSDDLWHNMLTVRIKAGASRVTVQITDFKVYSDSNTAFQLAIFKNATLPGGLTWIDSSPFTEYARVGGPISGGFAIHGSVGGGQRETFAAFDISFIKDKISLRYDGSSETYTLAMRRLKSQSDLAAAMTFTEFRS